MKYLTTYMLQSGEEGTSLLLQQYSCRGIPVCFACLCTCGEENREAGRYITGQLYSWCRSFPWHKAVRKPEKWMEQAERELEKKIKQSLDYMGSKGMVIRSTKVNWRILLCMEEEVLMLGNGQEAYLLYMSLGKGIVKRLGNSFRGALEPGAGILLLEKAVNQEEEKELGEVLQLSGLETEEQAARHLGEYAKKAAEKIPAAIMLLTKEDNYE